MKPNFRVTYDIVTPESAENGDTAEGGFVLPGGYHVPIFEALKDKAGVYDMTLREALGLAQPLQDSGSWWSEESWTRDYGTGEEESRSIHPPRNITESSYRRITRLMGIRVR